MLSEFYNIYGLNQELFVYINNLTNVSNLPVIMQFISSLFFIGNFAIGYLLFCLYEFFYIKHIATEQRYDYFSAVFRELVRVGMIYAFFGLTYAALKFSIKLPRPFCNEDIHLFTTIIQLDGLRCNTSFPSAHTALSIFVAYILWPYANNISKLLLICLVSITAISRITLAMHYPMDLVWSAVIIYFIITISNLIYFRLREKIIDPLGKILYIIMFGK